MRAASGARAVPPDETDEQKTIRQQAQRIVELELEVEEAGDVLTELKRRPRLLSFDWMMERPRRVEACTPLTRDQLVANVELLEAAGAAGACAAALKNPLLRFRDAYTMSIVRLYRSRPYAFLGECVGHVSSTGGLQKDRLRRCLLTAQETAVFIGHRTTFRPLDRAYVRDNRVPCMQGEFGPGGDYGPRQKIYDGLKISINATAQPKKHRVLHNSYFGGPCAQTQIGIGATFRILLPTYAAAGSHNESACLKGALDQIKSGLVEGDCVGTDKGMDMVDMLAPFGIRHVRTTWHSCRTPLDHQDHHQDARDKTLIWNKRACPSTHPTPSPQLEDHVGSRGNFVHRT